MCVVSNQFMKGHGDERRRKDATTKGEEENEDKAGRRHCCVIVVVVLCCCFVVVVVVLCCCCVVVVLLLFCCCCVVVVLLLCCIVLLYCFVVMGEQVQPISLAVLFLLCFFCVSSLAGDIDIGQCHDTVMLRDKEGVVIDHTLPNTNYSSDFPLFCAWDINPEDVEATKYTTIVFDYIDLVNRDDRQDYIRIYDGDMDDEVLFVLTGKHVPAPIMSSGRRVYVKFVVGGPTDPGTYTGLGFQFRYSSGACPNDCNGRGYCYNDACSCEGGYGGADCSERVCANDCGGAARGHCVEDEGYICECTPGYYGGDCTAPYCEGISEFTTASGNFSDHHSSELGNEYYEHNTFCQWLIRPPPVGDSQLQLIQLHFNTFDTELDNDFVRVYDGEDSETANLLGEFSGDAIPSDVFSATGVLLVTFETDIGIASEGFSCSYQVEAKKIDIVTQHHQMSDWLSAIIAAFAFILGLIIGTLLFSLGSEMARSTEEEEGSRRIDEEEGNYSRVEAAVVAEDASDLLERSPSPLLEEEGEEEEKKEDETILEPIALDD